MRVGQRTLPTVVDRLRLDAGRKRFPFWRTGVPPPNCCGCASLGPDNARLNARLGRTYEQRSLTPMSSPSAAGIGRAFLETRRERQTPRRRSDWLRSAAAGRSVGAPPCVSPVVRGPVPTPDPAFQADLRTLPGITLPCATRADQAGPGCALSQLANLYRSPSQPGIAGTKDGIYYPNRRS